MYGGLHYSHPEFTNFTTYDLQDVLPVGVGRICNSFAEDADHSVWLGSEGGGVVQFHPSTRKLTQPQGLNIQAPVRSLLCTGTTVAIGTYCHGIAFYDTRTHQTTYVPILVDASGVAIESSVQSMFLEDSTLWLGTYSNICTYDARRQCIHVEQENTSLVNDICRTCDGRLWFATAANGLLSYDPKSRQWKTYAIPATCYMLCADADDHLWIGTAHGLYLYTAQTDTPVNVQLGHHQPVILGIVADKGQLWLTTSLGLIHYLPAEGRVIQEYRAGGGLTNADFMQGSILQTVHGDILAGTSTGFVVFHPRQMRVNATVPQPCITAVSVSGTQHPVGESLRLSYRDTVLRIHFSSMSLVHPQDNRYQYRLEGLDDDWNDVTDEPFATYTHLAPGTYTFRVRASNNDGVWSTDEATLIITVTPPFYWNTFSKIFYLLLLLAALTFFVRWLLRRRDRRHQAEIEQINTQKEIDIHKARIQFMSLSEQDSQFLSQVEQVIEQHYTSDDLSVELIAAEVGVSRSGLFSRLKKISDATPNEMIQMIRLRHAEALLKTGRYRVNEVCYQVGFNSPSYFSKCFQKRYGCTLAEYLS